MFDLYKAFAVNLDTEKNGKWVSIGGGQFLIARANNDNFNKLFVELFEKNKEKLEAGDDAADALGLKLSAEVTAKTILLGWKGKIGFKGKELPYSVDNAIKLLVDPEMKEFRRVIAKESDNVENFRAQAEAEQEKN